MKTQVIRLGAAFCAAALLFCTAGCTTGKMDQADVQAVFQQAVQNSLEADLYFWKETTLSGKDSTYREVNVYDDLDKHYEPVVDADGNYANLKIFVQEKNNQKLSKELICGASNGKSSADPVRDMLFTTLYNAAGESTSKATQPMTAQEFYQSEAFKKYTLPVMLQELTELTADDMDFQIKKGLIEEKGKTTTLEFGIKSEYLQRYEQKYGTPSLFAGADRISIEMIYDKISHIVVYLNDDTDLLGLEVERYKLEIVYFGPKVTVPNYNEVDKVSSQPVWTQAV